MIIRLPAFLSGKQSFYEWVVDKGMNNNLSRQTVYKTLFLNSYEWAIFRKAMLAAYDYTCQVCDNRGGPLVLHHLNYDDPYSLNPKDVAPVHEECHALIHNKPYHRRSKPKKKIIDAPGQLDWLNRKAA